MQHPVFDEVGQAGRRVVEPLGSVAAEADEEVGLGLGLHAFGDHGHAEGVGEVDDGGDDRWLGGAGGEPADEGAIDLDEVDGNMRRWDRDE